jgi:hypothetical protein
MPRSGITPASPGSGGFAAAGRGTVRNFHRLIYHGIDENSEVPFLSPTPVYNTSETSTLLISHNPVSIRARRAAEGGATPASPGSGGFAAAGRGTVRNFHPLIHHGIRAKFRSSVSFTHSSSNYFCNFSTFHLHFSLFRYII